MNKNQIRKIIKLHWLKISIATIITILLISLIALLIIGTKHFMELESFYKKMTLASIPLQLFLSVITAFVFASIYMGFHYWFMFGGGMTKMGQKNIKAKEVNVKWSDVIGMESAKKEVGEVITLINDRAQLKKVGGRIIKGLLMVGPPGCGKTYLAKAIATETGLPFLSAVGSEFVGIIVGMGASKIKSLFKEARVMAEIHGGCLIFVDEIDAVARARMETSGINAASGMDHNATVNQLLTEMDGLRQGENNIVVIAATNINESELDPALMRAGRFDRKIYVGKPNLQDRKKLFEFYLDKVNFDSSINIDVLARKVVGFSPADIANMVREASLITTRDGQDKITFKSLSLAYDRVVFGLRSQIDMSEEEKIWTAYHEAGHAIIAYFTHPTNDVIKASIAPHKGALGFISHRPKEELHTPSKPWFLANIKTSLGGYVAEKLKFGTTTSGVSQDLATALRFAHDMVFKYGMGHSGLLGNFDALSIPSYLGNQLNISEETKRKIDDDVQTIINECLIEVEGIISKEKDLLENFAQELLKKDELEYDEIVEIFKKHGKERLTESSS